MSSRSGSADAFPDTTRRSSSTIRARRLISFNDDDEDRNGRQPPSTVLSSKLSPEGPALRSRGATPSPRPSRTVSPIPMSHPSRVTQSPSGPRSGDSLGGSYSDNRNEVMSAKSSRTAVDILDVSWSSLQSLASSLLGSDIARPASNGAPRAHVRKPSRPGLSIGMPSRTSTWGPSGSTTPEIRAGTTDERQALLQAKKMEALLLADTDPSWSLNARHKRRISSDQGAQSRINPDQEEEALVYIHQVQPTDSITSVTIRYGCQPAIFRKANGFWPSDSIQGRKTVLLPVDCCSIKGRPVQRQEVDLLQQDARRRSLEDLSGSSIVPTPVSETPISSRDEGRDNDGPEAEGDRIWKHESWVQVEGFPEPVEIGRVSRGALGFFPRTRRKSLCYSDFEPSRGREPTPATYSSSSSPVQPSSHRRDYFQDRSDAGSSEPRAPGNLKPGGRHRRQRSGLELSGTGVGTLDRNITTPGPAMDGLSKFFAAHLPSLAPARTPPDFDSLNENSSTAPSSNSTSLDSIGGAVEGWVRKMTARAKSSLSDLQQGASNAPGQGRNQSTGRRRVGDLIELSDGVESRNSSGLLAGPNSSWNPDLNRSGAAHLSNGANMNLRGRFPSTSPSTSRSRSGLDRVKDD